MAGFAAVFVFVFYLIIYTETFLMNEAQINSEVSSLAKYLSIFIPLYIFHLFSSCYRKRIFPLESLYTKVKSGYLIEVQKFL